MLERVGLTVVSDRLGRGGPLTLARSGFHPDLVVLDLGLPDVPGEESGQGGSPRLAETPILMLTAKVTGADRIRGLELGADDYLTKPFSPRELVLRVQAVLRRGRVPAAVDGPASFGGGRAGH